MFGSAKLLVAAVCAAMAIGANAQTKTVRIAWADPLSGPMAPIGQMELDGWRQAIELANNEKWAGDYRFEVVPFDNKLSPTETIGILNNAISQGIQYFAQGNSSAAAAAVIGAVEKHNARNPGKEVIYLNYMAADPDLTNKHCSYWQFRFEAHSGMKMKALVSEMAKDSNIKKVFLIHQNYAHGQTSSAAAKEFLAQMRPDIQIVGDELHPMATVKDFAPYVAKIKSSGADAVISANWGSDLSLLAKAMSDFGLTTPLYNYFSQNPGAPTAMGPDALQRAKTVVMFNPNGATASGEALAVDFKKRFGKDMSLHQMYNTVGMLAKAIKNTGSADPAKVAAALADINIGGLTGPVTMRREDHQLQQPLFMGTWAKVDGKAVKYEQEGTGFGLRTDATIPANVASLPTTCEMKRP